MPLSFIYTCSRRHELILLELPRDVASELPNKPSFEESDSKIEVQSYNLVNESKVAGTYPEDLATTKSVLLPPFMRTQDPRESDT